jgi:hypothetical protein
MRENATSMLYDNNATKTIISCNDAEFFESNAHSSFDDSADVSNDQ